MPLSNYDNLFGIKLICASDCSDLTTTNRKEIFNTLHQHLAFLTGAGINSLGDTLDRLLGNVRMLFPSQIFTGIYTEERIAPPDGTHVITPPPVHHDPLSIKKVVFEVTVK